MLLPACVSLLKPQQWVASELSAPRWRISCTEPFGREFLFPLVFCRPIFFFLVSIFGPTSRGDLKVHRPQRPVQVEGINARGCCGSLSTLAKFYLSAMHPSAQCLMWTIALFTIFPGVTSLHDKDARFGFWRDMTVFGPNCWFQFYIGYSVRNWNWPFCFHGPNPETWTAVFASAVLRMYTACTCFCFMFTSWFLWTDTVAFLRLLEEWCMSIFFLFCIYSTNCVAVGCPQIIKKPGIWKPSVHMYLHTLYFLMGEKNCR